jgi:hypothetical protein
MKTLEEGTVIKCTRRSSRYSLVDEGEYYEVARHVHGSPVAWLMCVRTGVTLCVSLENVFEPVCAAEFLVHQITQEVHSN